MQKVDQIIKKMAAGGAAKLHILADFDRTLTLAFVNGVATPSITAILRDHNYLTPDYPAKAKALYAHYGAIEKDPKFPKEKKKELMNEWWRAHFDLLMKSGLSKNDIAQAMASGIVQFRPGALEFIDTLHKHDIPLVIMSASGIGEESISARLKQENRHLKNIHIIGNAFIWDENDKAIGFREPIITGMNKDKTMIQSFPAFEAVKDRPNVILLGDNLGDVGMVEGFPFQNLLKIGFLNEPTPEAAEEYAKHFDVIIPDDGPFDYVNEVLKKVIDNADGYARG